MVEMTGRPRSFDRDHALDLALDAFWERGYDNTSIAEITAAIGITAPSLYAAFGGKQALFDEAAERYLTRLRPAVEEALAMKDIHAAIERVLRDSAAHYTARSCPRGCLIMSEPRLTDARRWWHEVLTERLRQAQVEGALDPGADVDALAGFVDVVLSGLSARARDGATGEQLQAIADRALLAWPVPPASAPQPTA